MSILKNIIDNKFKKFWKHYLLQILLATLILLFIILILGREKVVTISAMAATSFILFAMPNSIPAKTKNVIGGHLVGLVCGSLFYFTTLPFFIEYSFSVGIAIFLMVILNVEHPPAAATALAVAINEVSLEVFVTIMASAIILSQVRWYLRKYLKDLV